MIMGIDRQMSRWGWAVWNYLMLYVLGAWYLLKELSIPHKSLTGIPSQKGRVVVVTGGGRGIGLETVRQFLRLDMTVVIAGRDVNALEKAVLQVRAEGVKTGVTKCLDLDVSSLTSVRRFAKEFSDLGLPLHILVNNAGIMFWPWKITEDGFEHHWAVNYLGHVLLTHLLLPRLIASSTTDVPSRIVSLTSSVHYIGTVNFSDINNEKDYNPQAAYAQSKLAQMMFTITLGEYLTKKGVLTVAVHPGVVATDLFQHVTWATTFPRLTTTFLKSPRQGSDTVVYAALSPDVKDSGHYYENCCCTKPSSAALKAEDRSRLWDITCHQLGIQEFGQL